MQERTILIIDDDRELASTLKTVLEGQGYVVVLAVDSEEGIARARSRRPDLIILDVMMRTTGEGIAAAQQIKHDKELQAIPIVMLTAVSEETGFSFSPETDGEYLPVEKFMEKPVDPQELVRAVKRLID
jgi:CheY-like chemotaxis protein